MTGLPPLVGSKKTGTPNWRSMKSAAKAADSAVVAIISSGAVANSPQQKSGIRVKVMPGARIFKNVTIDLNPVIVEPMPTKKIAAARIDVPAPPCSETGGYSYFYPAVGAPDEKRREQHQTADREDPEAQHIQPREGTSRAPICNGKTRFPKPPVKNPDDNEPYHHATVNAVDFVIRIGRDEAAVRVEQLSADHFRQQAAENEEDERSNDILYADDLVIQRKDISPNEALGVWQIGMWSAMPPTCTAAAVMPCSASISLTKINPHHDKAISTPGQ